MEEGRRSSPRVSREESARLTVTRRSVRRRLPDGTGLPATGGAHAGRTTGTRPPPRTRRASPTCRGGRCSRTPSCSRSSARRFRTTATSARRWPGWSRPGRWPACRKRRSSRRWAPMPAASYGRGNLTSPTENPTDGRDLQRRRPPLLGDRRLGPDPPWHRGIGRRVPGHGGGVPRSHGEPGGRCRAGVRPAAAARCAGRRGPAHGRELPAHAAALRRTSCRAGQGTGCR